jgi:hypothetical protein
MGNRFAFAGNIYAENIIQNRFSLAYFVYNMYNNILEPPEHDGISTNRSLSRTHDLPLMSY